jgi:hypothetical protein
LLLLHYGIFSIQAASFLLVFWVVLLGKSAGGADLVLLGAMIWSLALIRSKIRFFKGDAFISGGPNGEVGLSLPATTNYKFWGLWCAIELMGSLFALWLGAKALVGL